MTDAHQEPICWVIWDCGMMFEVLKYVLGRVGLAVLTDSLISITERSKQTRWRTEQPTIVFLSLHWWMGAVLPEDVNHFLLIVGQYAVKCCMLPFDCNPKKGKKGIWAFKPRKRKVHLKKKRKFLSLICHLLTLMSFQPVWLSSVDHVYFLFFCQMAT